MGDVVRSREVRETRKDSSGAHGRPLSREPAGVSETSDEQLGHERQKETERMVRDAKQKHRG
jgi:hypothetical protein